MPSIVLAASALRKYTLTPKLDLPVLLVVVLVLGSKFWLYSHDVIRMILIMYNPKYCLKCLRNF